MKSSLQDDQKVLFTEFFNGIYNLNADTAFSNMIILSTTPITLPVGGIGHMTCAILTPIVLKNTKSKE